jgi:hypothetical protein
MTPARLAVWLGIASVVSCAARSAPATTTPTTMTTTTSPPTTPESPVVVTTAAEQPTSHVAASGPGAFCLIVGPTQIVVRCYWTRQSCDDQIGFNTENGLTQASECRPTPEPRCFQYKHGELCYPGSADCEKNRTAMNRYPDEQPSACEIKTAP